MPWRDSTSRPIAPVSSVAGGDDTTLFVDHAAKTIFVSFCLFELKPCYLPLAAIYVT
jgi:hypothetical protein